VGFGFARILRIDGCIHDGWLAFEDVDATRLDKLFLLRALNSVTEHFRRLAPEGTQPNLNTSLMKAFRIILPPVSLQRQFADRVLAIEKSNSLHRDGLSRLGALFVSLQHRAFRGEL
jgi:type I restriction enzyme S subunit